MCGITGELSREEIDPAGFYAAHDRLSHRGPDDEGFVAGDASGNVTQLRGRRTRGSWRDLPDVHDAPPIRWMLGHHRLSVIDVSEKGHCPFGASDGRVWLTYNGEVYNYRELRGELERAGHAFRSETDTEVVLAAYLEWGLDCFQRFNGMWGLAIADIERDRLVLCRDRFGVKPLYWRANLDGLAFASEIPFLLSREARGPNLSRCAEFLATGRIDHGSQTVFEGINALEPGHVLTADLRGASPRVERWWHLENGMQTRPDTLEEAASHFADLFDDAIELRMRSDVPVGALLSGGLDSTSIVRNLHSRSRVHTGGLHTFSAVYPESEHSELSLIEHTLAASPGLRSHLVEPIRSLAVYAQRAVYRVVRERSPVVVLLNGQGADEVFAGYTDQRSWLIAGHLRQGRLAAAAAEARWLARNGHSGTIRSLLRGLKRLWTFRRAVDGSIRTREQPPLFCDVIELDEPLDGPDPLTARRRADLFHSPLPEYLRYEDRNSMAFSLETRLPFLDYRLAEWAIGLEADHLIKGDETKRVVRHAVGDYVPEAIRLDHRKRGFTIPQVEWQRRHLGAWIERGVEVADWPFLDRSAVRSEYDAYRRGAGDPLLLFRLGALGAWRELVASTT